MSDAERARKTNRLAKNARRRNFGDTAGPKPSVNLDELRELIALLRDNGLAEFELEREGFRVRLRRDSDFLVNSGAAAQSAGAAPAERESNSSARAAAVSQRASAQTAPVHPGAQAETAASEDQDLQIIPSPIVGTFYRAASPNAEPFVKIGSRVAQDSVVCIIEAMKLMNEIQAEASGEVVKIYVENGQPVEYGQPLFGLRK